MSEACNTLNMDKEPGFTLVELLITIVVVTILLAAGVPAFKDFIKNNRVTAQANALAVAIQMGRNEAVKRGVNVVVCASKNATDESQNVREAPTGPPDGSLSQTWMGTTCPMTMSSHVHLGETALLAPGIIH